jgi:DNA-binding NarL/FixJ family response regulator
MKNVLPTERPPTTHPIVLIADAHMLVRDGLKMMVAGMLGDVQFLEAHDAESLLQATQAHPAVRLALVDLKMPGMHDGQRLAEVARRYPSLPLIVVSAVATGDVVRRVMSIATVHAFVPKSAGFGYMRSAIEAAMAGRKLPFLLTGRTQPGKRGPLTARQEQIRNLLRQGMSNKMIANALGISTGTVKNHITDIFKILNASNRTQAAQLNRESSE